ncbi:hypothetical protein L873DRAFT_1838972 [Choiromyces venosus 120613-1]|uniref:Uncharacterized protein n=1 Tax=Choiromyces venosus 120613-1 TaxID=1336337 RepID=A0A3N4IWC4_9PEZI|nr:hypothetical protein L873DRAFT_1838972 [Choiromyces venosus 120613-1]
MPLDYSKWDKYVPSKLELSDDSDIECHPNQITNLCIECSMNEVLLSRISKLISTLDEGSKTSRSPEEIVFQSLMDISTADNGPKEFTPREGTPLYAQMMGSLVNSIKKQIDAEKPDDRWTAFLYKLKEHKDKLTGVHNDSGKRLADLEKDDNEKIASDKAPVPKKESAKRMQKVQAVEQLNWGVKVKDPLALDSSYGADTNVQEGSDEADEDVDHVEPTALGKEFSHIKLGDYRMEFISYNPAVVAEKETDGLLIEAFNSQIAGKEDYAKQCYFLSFRRITTPNHQAQKVFHEDVTTTYGGISERGAAIANERSNSMPSKSNSMPSIRTPKSPLPYHRPKARSQTSKTHKESKIIDATTQQGQQVLKKIEEEERGVKANVASSSGVMEMDRKVSENRKGKEETPKDEDLVKEID